jgi:large subunit ribosomal protein L4e
MKAQTLSLSGAKQGEVDLPNVFLTPFRKDLIHKAFVNLDSHHYQRQGRHPTAGMDVVAMSNDPPTGHGQARIARIRGGGPRRKTR